MDAHGEEVACVQRRAWMELPQNRFLRGIYLLVQRYLRHNVGMQIATIALTLTLMSVGRSSCPGRSCPSSGCTSPMWAGTPV